MADMLKNKDLADELRLRHFSEHLNEASRSILF